MTFASADMDEDMYCSRPPTRAWKGAARRAVARRSAAPQPMAMMSCSAQSAAPPQMMTMQASIQAKMLSDCYASEFDSYRNQDLEVM